MNTAQSRGLYLAVAGCAVTVFLGALLNGYALDDIPIVATNPFVHSWRALWQAFGEPYWPHAAGAAMYRPLAVASYVLDWHLGGAALLHAVNLVWHAATSVAVAALARRWSGGSQGAALLAGVVFAVHPVHVEAVANIIGRTELMATFFAVLSVWIVLEHDHLWWSLAAWTLGLFSKETAIVVPALVIAGWIASVGRQPSRRRMLAYGLGWLGLGSAYLALRWSVLHSAAHHLAVAPVFVEASPIAVRLTAISSFTDFARLLVFPLKLRADYSPAERTLVTTSLDGRVLLGLGCLLAWVALVVWAWRRGRRVEAFGLLWIVIALMPVSNLLFPSGVLVAERTLYLPSVGFALAVAVWVKEVPIRRWWAVAALVVLLGGVRTALRVPVWASQQSVLASVIKDSPRSYVVPLSQAETYLAAHEPEQALESIRAMVGITDHAPKALVWGADVAFHLGRPQLADSLLTRLDRICRRCAFYHEFEARAAWSRGDSTVADSFLVRAAALR